MPITQAVPLFRVTDVARSMEWYRSIWPSSAIRFLTSHLMNSPFCEMARRLRRGTPPVRPGHRPYDWDVYLRREGSQFQEVFAAFNARGIATRRLERMFYGLAEFEITDPDGYVICLSQMLEDASDLPTPPV